jgi:hypothetical protein
MFRVRFEWSAAFEREVAFVEKTLSRHDGGKIPLSTQSNSEWGDSLGGTALPLIMRS